MMQNTFYTIDEIAELWKISRDTVLRLIEKKELGAIKIGRQWRISDEDLEKFIGQEKNPE